MPIPDTKYNYRPLDLCNNQFNITKHIIFCDVSDTNLETKIYLNSKASFLIHPLSVVSNCVSQFSPNINNAFKYKAPIPCPIDASSSHSAIQIQKALQNVLHTSSSNFTQVLSSLTSTTDIISNSSNRPWHNASDRAQKHGLTNNNYSSSQKVNSGIDIKHNSYDRYLAKKKGLSLRTQYSNAPKPLQGNKTKYYSISTHNICTKAC